jgi:uncharacterized protein
VSAADRDRDERGRARNARPRDEAGRPLAHDSEGVASPDDAAARTADEALALADELLAAARPFAAHEVLETAWHRAADDERDLWQGLAQLAVGLTHLQRGNTTGAVALLRRGSERLAAYGGTRPHGVGIDRVCRTARSLADAVATGDTDPGQPSTLRLRG